MKSPEKWGQLLAGPAGWWARQSRQQCMVAAAQLHLNLHPPPQRAGLLSSKSSLLVQQQVSNSNSLSPPTHHPPLACLSGFCWPRRGPPGGVPLLPRPPSNSGSAGRRRYCPLGGDGSRYLSPAQPQLGQLLCFCFGAAASGAKTPAERSTRRCAVMAPPASCTPFSPGRKAWRWAAALPASHEPSSPQERSSA